VLDPRYKSIFWNSDQLLNIKYEFTEKYESNSLDGNQPQEPKPTEPGRKNMSITQQHILKKQAIKNGCVNNGHYSLEQQLNCYLDESCVDISLCPLKWWRETGKHKFPKLFKCAKHYLPIPASEVSSERVFSLTGNIMTDDRCRLSTEIVTMLLFVKQNMGFF
jgi:hypothetical protein